MTLHVNKNDVTSEQKMMVHVNKKCFSWRILLSKHNHYFSKFNKDPSDLRLPSAIKLNVTSARIT